MDDGAGARGLRSPSAEFPRRRCRPPWDRAGGRLPGMPRVAALMRVEAARGTGRGAAGGVGPTPQPLCPCAPPPGPAVAGGGRWPVAEAASGPLGTALSIGSDLPLPNPTRKKKKGTVNRE